MRTRSTILALALALSLASVLFGGCGTDDASPASPTATAPAAAGAQGDTGATAPAATKAAATPTAGTPTATPAASSGATATGASEKLNACDLVTIDEAEAAVGAQLTTGRSATQQSSEDPSVTLASCSFLGTGASRNALTLLLRISTADKAVAGYSAAKKEAGSPVDLPGIGDEAFWWPGEGQVNALKGGTWFIMRAQPIPGDGQAPLPVLDLAKAAVGRLP